jgi:hypothetical protein
MEAAPMKSLSTRSFVAGSAIWLAFAAFNGAALAESLEVQCRAAARAELKGPDCRMVMPPNPASACNIPTQTEVHIYDNKTLECLKRGGPGRQPKV